ncbi:23 kDa integral membrane protein [Manduca sexta]|uniref:Tetraspanin n=1 Tax=Manduca sexta TaxID=7130 RepID=A0A921ZHF7_MANSE|nr:23 kDa integral membrane protein [Manduca sexta]KAG6458051.1 hypothetical protein O3G_MSEX010639 [Manduca sexta]KAG6458052.1 hypothetical protein O3G_MSEX010639 [Manduca sexta]
MASTVLLHILNTVQMIFGLALTAASIWFFIEVQSITSLRNTNHYLLDYNVYWPQAIPWIFMIVGIFILCISCCGFAGARKKNRGMVVLFAIFQSIAIVGLVAAAIVALTCADSKSTDKFMEDTIWDVYTHTKNDRDVEMAFGNIEKRLQCCGAGGPRDYLNWRREFPISCCDTYYHGWIGAYNIDCDFTNKLANERHGCSAVAVNYTRVIIKVLAGASVFTAFIGIMSLIVAVALILGGLKKKSKMVLAPHEMESKKVLL